MNTMATTETDTRPLAVAVNHGATVDSVMAHLRSMGDRGRAYRARAAEYGIIVVYPNGKASARNVGMHYTFGDANNQMRHHYVVWCDCDSLMG